MKYPIGVENPGLTNEFRMRQRSPQIETVTEEDSEAEELWTFVPNNAQMKRCRISPDVLASYLRSYINESYLGPLPR